MICVNCGAQVEEGLCFCRNCGKRVFTKENDKAVSKPKSQKKIFVGCIVGTVAAMVIVCILAGVFLNSNYYKLQKETKRAAASYKKGDYEGALDSYDTILSLDDSRSDAYLNMAQIYIEKQNFDKAIQVIQNGNKRCELTKEEQENFSEKLVQAYLNKADELAENEELDSAIQVLLDCFPKMKDSKLRKQISEKYLSYVDMRIGEGKYDYARDILFCAEKYLDKGDIQEKEIKIYRSKSDIYFEKKDYVRAVQALEEGIERTGADSLKRREQYLREHTVVLQKDKYNSDGKLYSQDTYEYDDQGNRTKYISRNSDGYIVCWTENDYDSEGNMTMEARLLPDGTPMYRYVYEYDMNGNLIKETACNTDGSPLSSWTEYEYDVNGNKTKELSRDSDGSTRISWRGTYDTKGNLVNEKFFLGGNQGNEMYGTEYEYDANGNRVKSIERGFGWIISGWTEYTYDAFGNQVEEKCFDENGQAGYVNRYEYDENGNEILYEEYDEDGEMYAWGMYEYDKNGNMIYEAHYGYRGEVYRICQYEYDALNNRISGDDSKTKITYGFVDGK